MFTLFVTFCSWFSINFSTSENKLSGISLEIAKIKPEHDVAVAEVVRLVLTEYGANKPGFAWDDPQLDHLSKTYADENSQYLVVIQDGVVMGGGGIGPLEGGDSHVC